MKMTIKFIKYFKGSFRLLPLLLLVVLISACEVDDTQEVVTFKNLVMEDNFDVEGAPSSSLWTYDIGRGPNGDGWGNQELQYYTDRSENVRVENGFLVIQALEESFEGANYTSGRILTKGLFDQQYGRFEARIRLPYGKGLWPAFWLLGSNIDQVGWPQCGEIDVMENAGSRPTVVSSAVHGPGYNAGLAITKEFDFEDERVDTQFHVYGIEWGPGYINFYVDDKLYNQITPEDVTGDWVFDNGPFYILLNVAVGGNWPGAPNASTTFPQTMLIDYVRVYKAG